MWNDFEVLLVPVFEKDRFQKQCYDFDSLMTPSDTKVLIRGGELLSGYICKKHIGNTTNSLIHIITLDWGCERVKQFIGDVQMMTKAYTR
jgi:hypothetical protein